jgi:hypothetical protein
MKGKKINIIQIKSADGCETDYKTIACPEVCYSTYLRGYIVYQCDHFTVRKVGESYADWCNKED